jgi:Tfp pilus assembly protein PilF
MPSSRRKKRATAVEEAAPRRTGKSADPPIRSIDLEEFVRRLHADSNAEKRYALFLGAGCSVTSGIPSAGGLVRDRWLPRLRDYQAPGRADLEAWAKEVIRDYDPANPALSYGGLIDRLFLTPEDRQREIEDLCDGRTPSFGYAVLAQLVAQPAGRFNVVLTTNFDDLVADALYLYTEARPLVIYHESLAAFIRPTRTRPLVVKLHGDHRLSPRNTALETQSLEKEIQRHTAMVLHDRGIVFMGYAGSDLGILKLLNELPREALPFGAYWVHPHEPRGELRKWLSNRQGVWVRSGWFDEVMLLIRNGFGLPHPSGERFNRIFQDYHGKFQELSKSIQDKPPDEVGVKALKDAVRDTESLFPDFWKVVSEAHRLESQDPDRAYEAYRQGAAHFPNEAPLLGNYALFLENNRKDFGAAEAMYKRALEVDPKHANNLGNYAIFLTKSRKDVDAAEAMYKRALEADPKHANSLGNYATFLKNRRKDFVAAEAMYKRALEADPKHANNLGNYAHFLNIIRKDFDAAEAMYKRALEADPKDANNHANFAGLLLAAGRPDGLVVLEKARELLREFALPPAELECEFYRFTHGPLPERAAALLKIKALLEHGVRSPGWDLSRNISRALQDGHSEGSWLSKLANVVNGEADLDVLGDWPAWNGVAAQKQDAADGAPRHR